MSTKTVNCKFKSDGNYWYCNLSSSSKSPYKSECDVSLTRDYGKTTATLKVYNIKMYSGWGDMEDWRITVTAGGKSAVAYHIGYNSVPYNSDNMHKQYKWYTFVEDTKDSSGKYPSKVITFDVPVDPTSGKVSVTIKFEITQGWLHNKDKAPIGTYVDNSRTINVDYDSIGASTITSASNITLGNAPAINFTPYTNSFYFKIKYSIGSWSHTTSAIKPTTANQEYTYNLYTVPVSVANQITTSTSGSITILLSTYSDSACTNLIGSSSKNITATVPTNIVPTISDLSMSLVNDNSTINGWGVAVQGYTKINLKADASGAYGSTIKSFTITGSISASYTGAPLNFMSSVLNISGSNKTFTVKAVDSRGRSSTTLTTSPIQFYSYAKPTISSYFVERGSQDTTSVSAGVNWVGYSVGGNNKYTATMYYKRGDSTAWVKYPTSLPKNSTTTLRISPDGFAEDMSYTFRIQIKDSIGSTAEQSIYVGVLDVFMDWRAGGKGLGIGMMAENDGLWVKFPAHFNGEVTKRVYKSDGTFTDYTLKQYIQGVVNGSI